MVKTHHRFFIADKISLLNYLVKVEFHKKVFTLWMKRKKNVGELDKEFRIFINQLELSMLDVLNNQKKEKLKHIINLEPNDIKIFDFYLIPLETKKLPNKGMKYFYKKEFSKALNYLSGSSKINPDNTLTYWNMARFGCILKLENHMVIENYKKALKLIKKQKNHIKARKRVTTNKGKKRLIPKEPIPGDHPII